MPETYNCHISVPALEWNPFVTEVPLDFNVQKKAVPWLSAWMQNSE